MPPILPYYDPRVTIGPSWLTDDIQHARRTMTKIPPHYPYCGPVVEEVPSPIIGGVGYDPFRSAPPVGCICPPGANVQCERADCPRKAK